MLVLGISCGAGSRTRSRTPAPRFVARHRIPSRLAVAARRRECRGEPGSRCGPDRALSEAKSHFERALQIEPNQPIAKENLEALQKEMNSHESNCLVPLPLFDLALSGNDLSFQAWRGTCCLLMPADSRLLVASLPGMPRPLRFRSFMIRCSEFCDLRIVL